MAGAVGGGAAPVTGPLGYIAVNAATGAGQKVATDILVNGRTFAQAVLDPNTTLAAGTSALGAIAGGQMSKVLKFRTSNGEIMIFATGKEATAYGGERFAKTTGEMLLSEQTSINARAFAGATLANMPISVPDKCVGFECWFELFTGVEKTTVELPCTLNPDDNY